MREREIKLAVPADFELPPLTDPGGDVFADHPETLVLDATYFDAEDLRLIRAGTELRWRIDEGWLVKLPAPGGGDGVLSRDEHRFAGVPGVAPDAALDLVRAQLRSASVQAVATLRTRRTRVQLRDSEGKPVAEVADDHVDVLDGAPEVSSFRELEVELADTASDGQRTAILIRLRGAGAGQTDPTAKVARALGVRATAPADVAVPAVDEPTIDAVVRHALASGVERLVAHDPAVRAGEDPEAVHQARVATRRLRSDLRTFRSLVDESWAEGLRDELRWLGDVLGGVRDADVLLERLEQKVERLPESDRPPAGKLIELLRHERAHRREELLTALRSDRYALLLDRLVLAARRPRLLLRVDDDDDLDVLRGLVRRPWKHLRRAVEELPEEPADPELHKVRIRAKRARYAAEAVEPAFGKPAWRFARALSEVQDVLGDHQDSVVATDWLRRTAADAGEEAGFAAGQLAALEHADAGATREAWPRAWKNASRGRLRNWL